ncbi:MAG: hypothetical protein HQK49_04445 [Oligoflexia bacterium]|nr:hypothetical protein [Oligoflexia bacterium]
MKYKPCWDLLHRFSENHARMRIPDQYKKLYDEMRAISDREYFPAIKEDLGRFLQFLSLLKQPKKIFEFGSGYGQSAFWFLLSINNIENNIEAIYLTETKERLWKYYDSLPWPQEWLLKINYYRGDAFKAIEELNVEEIDLLFMDGQKSSYLDFFLRIENRMSTDFPIVVVDNIFWKGNILNDLSNQQSNQQLNQQTDLIKKMSYPSVNGIEKFYNYINNSNWHSIFFPYYDGVLLLYK